MEKYLGNKRVLLDTIYKFTQEVCPNTSSICDIFAGTTNVARYFRNQGFSTISNDINRFSFILGTTYLVNNEYPKFLNLKINQLEIKIDKRLKKYFLASIKKDKNQLHQSTNIEEEWDKLNPLIKVLSYLNNLDDKKNHSYYIVDYFTKEGKYSDYTSLRGTKVKRNYFSDNNANKLNIILDVIREWWLLEYISFTELSILLTSVIEEVVLVANVNGTFHDFNRNKLFSNALQEFYLKVPLISSSNKQHTVYNQDAMVLAKELPYTDILYLDPPYNFRQYTSYYHFINFISAYPFLDNIENYLKNITHVRGQNMDDEFKSTLCKRDSFVPSLRKIIMDSNSRYVIMSYYGARNHWNHWSKDDVKEDEGLKVLKELFEDKNIFSHSIIESTFQVRQNYQSRIGEKKSLINEYLFFGEKIIYNDNSKSSNQNLLSTTNAKFNLKYFTTN